MVHTFIVFHEGVFCSFCPWVSMCCLSEIRHRFPNGPVCDVGGASTHSCEPKQLKTPPQQLGLIFVFSCALTVGFFTTHYRHIHNVKILETVQNKICVPLLTCQALPLRLECHSWASNLLANCCTFCFASFHFLIPVIE